MYLIVLDIDFYVYTCDLQNPFFSVWTPKYAFLQFVGENSLRADFPIQAKLLDERRSVEFQRRLKRKV